MHVYWCTSRLCFGVKSTGGTHEHYAALLCNCVRGVNGSTKVKLALQNSTAVTWWHGFVKHMFTYHLDCVSLHTSYCYRTEDIPAVQEEVGSSTLRATVLNMTKIIGESDTSISRLQWEKKKAKVALTNSEQVTCRLGAWRGCKTVTGFVKMHIHTTQMYNQKMKERGQLPVKGGIFTATVMN